MCMYAYTYIYICIRFLVLTVASLQKTFYFIFGISCWSLYGKLDLLMLGKGSPLFISFQLLGLPFRVLCINITVICIFHICI